MVRINTPAYRHHKPSGQAVVTIDGRDIYLGKFGTEASKVEYDRLIAEWLTNGRRLPTAAGGTTDITVCEMVLAYLDFADGYYRKHGEPTSEYSNIKSSIRQFVKLYGRTLARDFGPMALKAVRAQMIEDGHCRKQINLRVARIVRAFKWAVENEMVPASVFQALRTVAGLRRGRSAAKESAPVRPVPEAFVDAIESHVPRQVWAMVQLQRLTGMRPGEVIIMRTCDLDTSGNVWLYRPESHKTEHHGLEKNIYLGPRAQEILRPWLRTELEAPLFSPAEAVAEWQAQKRWRRKSKVQPSQRCRKKAKPKRTPRDKYDVDSYRRAIHRGCDKAGVPRWGAHRLRHNAATWLRKEFGLDVARVVLGHRSPAVTEIYAEVDRQKAVEIMAKVG